jgi:hypothetical protein
MVEDSTAMNDPLLHEESSFARPSTDLAQVEVADRSRRASVGMTVAPAIRLRTENKP